MEPLTIVLLCICVCVAVLQVVLLLVLKGRKGGGISKEDKQEILQNVASSMEFASKSQTEAQKAYNENILSEIRHFKEEVAGEILRFREQTKGEMKELEDRLAKTTKQLDERVANISKMQEDKLEKMRESNERNIRAMQEDNAHQLEKINKTVSDKLDETINKRFNESFKLLTDRLEDVYKSLGEMQKMGAEVGNLTKVLSNVKTTGILGEVQLGAIFDQILTTDQYETNFVTGQGREPVEFAVKLPGQDDGYVYLPVDSKFPLTVYTDLQNAYDNNDLALVKAKREQLKNTIRGMAKDINTKYINPPKTTNFAIMFLPIEGLYAEVAKMGMIEELQNKFSVTIAGPTTMSALLSSLQMGFRTLAIQKKSGEVWKILGAVRTEFDKFSNLVQTIQKQFEKTSKDFDSLVGTRTRLLASKLSKVDRLDEGESQKVLQLKDVAASANETSSQDN